MHFDEFYNIASKNKDIIFSNDTDADSLALKKFSKQFFNTGVTNKMQ